MADKPRKAWAAAIFSFFGPGLGHLYAGSAKKGLLVLAAWNVMIIISVLCLLLPFSVLNIILFSLLFVTFSLFYFFDSIKLAIANGKSYELKKFNRTFYYILFYILVMASTTCFSFGARCIARPFKIPASSMMPSVLIGDQIFTNNIIYRFSDIKRGDIIVFPYPNNPAKDYIKRVIAVGGDSIEIREGAVYVNDRKIIEPYLAASKGDFDFGELDLINNMNRVKVADDSVFVMGDNREKSMDSRLFGCIEKSSIIGKVYQVYFSWDYKTNAVRWDRIGKRFD